MGNTLGVAALLIVGWWIWTNTFVGGLLASIWAVGWPGFVVAGIFIGSLALVAYQKRGEDITYKDWCLIVGFWFFVVVILKVIGLGN